MQLGFLIDHRRCIGCHACTVACKAENDVPVGSFRTWVKYQEKGRFPAIRRHFAVLRCNHCTSAPCVTICPVNALEKRKDGIVDLDRDACIGCRACMQGCPYDAIYLNEDSGAAEKCHYCAHRVEKGLEPACVVVCPVEAIVSGDLHDPTSHIARMVAENETLVRRPEQDTGPNVHYLGAEPSILQPGSAERPSTYLWSDRPPQKPEPWPDSLPLQPDTRVVLDAGHEVQWRTPVALYLVTKGIAAGAALLAPFAVRLGLRGWPLKWGLEWVALLFTLITTFLLVEDLNRPFKFFRLLTRPNTKSWLVKGAWILIAFTATVSATLACSFLERSTGLPPPLDRVAWANVAGELRWVSALLAIGVAGYTAFLFAQCEGRDLWQSRLLLPHLLAQAVFCGSTMLLFFNPRGLALKVLVVTAGALHFLFAEFERRGQHPTDNARQAAAFLDVVRFGPVRAFRVARTLVVLGIALAFVLPTLAFVPALAGLFLYEVAYVRAGQVPPLS
jgi:Fe-S-cluster-containing dehydrogenase component